MVWPYEQSNNEWNAKRGKPNFITTSINPPITELNLRLPRDEQRYFFFTDAELADRLAKATIHAVELCDGGQNGPEPF